MAKTDSTIQKIRSTVAIRTRARKLISFLRQKLRIRTRAKNLFIKTFGVDPGRFPEAAKFRLFSQANAAVLVLWRIRDIFRLDRSRVQSVLQVSIMTHKPFMLSRVLRAKGIKSDYLALNTDVGRLNIGFDMGIPNQLSPTKRRLLDLYYMWFVLPRYDVIHVHFNSFLTYSGREFDFAKRVGRILVFHYRGCDLRHKSVNMRLNPQLNCCQQCTYPEGSCDTEYQYQRIRRTKELGDLFFVTTPDLKDFMPEAEHIPFIMPVGMNLENIKPVPRDQGIFRIVTSSNHHGIDGTQFIRDAVKRLQDEGHKLELVEVNNTKYSDALAIYKSADLFVGKLRMGYYNNANIETLMLGVPNMSYIRPEFQRFVPDSPIIVTRPDTVYTNIKEYLGKREQLQAIGLQGPEFIKKYHSPDAVVDHLIARFNEAYNRKYQSRMTLLRRILRQLLHPSGNANTR